MELSVRTSEAINFFANIVRVGNYLPAAMLLVHFAFLMHLIHWILRILPITLKIPEANPTLMAGQAPSMSKLAPSFPGKSMQTRVSQF